MSEPKEPDDDFGEDIDGGLIDEFLPIPGFPDSSKLFIKIVEGPPRTPRDGDESLSDPEA